MYQEWEAIADKILKAEWSWGYCTATTETGASLFVVDAYKPERGRHVVHSGNKLAAFKELERITRDSDLSNINH